MCVYMHLHQFVSSKNHFRDESHNMMAGTLASLASQISGSLSSDVELRHYERLIVRLQDPYFRVMLTHLVMSDWSEILDEEVLPLRERLAIAFQFLDDKAVSSYLHRIKDRSCVQGDIEALIIPGLTKAGLDILQSYVDHTGDIQTVTILSATSRTTDPRVERWRESYRDLLDGFRMFRERVNFDIERGKHLLQTAVATGQPPPESVLPQIIIRCNYCNKTMNPPTPDTAQKHPVRIHTLIHTHIYLKSVLYTLTVHTGIGVPSLRPGLASMLDLFDDTGGRSGCCQGGERSVFIRRCVLVTCLCGYVIF